MGTHCTPCGGTNALGGEGADSSLNTVVATWLLTIVVVSAAPRLLPSLLRPGLAKVKVSLLVLTTLWQRVS